MPLVGEPLDETDAAIARGAGIALVRLLGRGASSRVYEALCERMGFAPVRVALKVLATDDADLRARFAREALLAARLGHPNLVRALEVRDHPERPFIVLELVAAPSLAQRLAARGPLSEEEARRHLEALGAALAYAHGEGVLHRDVKPQNILESEPAPKLCDLGLARASDAVTTLTRSGMWVGTLEYMAPEHATRAPIEAAADVYSLGATLYHALAGRPPFVARSVLELVGRMVHEQPVALRRLRPDVTRDLAALIEAMMEKTPGARPSMREIVGAARCRA